VDPYDVSSFFGNQRTMQRPVEGTVARGHLPYTLRDQKEAAVLINPLPRTEAVLLRGKKIYSERCIVCHGPLADGNGSLTAAYGAKPANLMSQTFLEGYTDGEMYHVLMKGKNAMPSQAADIVEDDRWAVIHYVRALQRAQNAKDADVEEALRQ
jgi:mono/diheme cytochrome c family protein